jgi:SWI/SNF-related matrix-associated actin-dependent regulator 1 of chromatin subfamily A
MNVGAQRPVVYCPAIVVSHWLSEFTEMGWKGAPPIVASYDRVVRGGVAAREKMLEYKPDALILDEAHLLRTPTAQRTKLILGKDGYARRIPRVWAASGTPMWKNPNNLWTVLSTLFPHVCASYGCTTQQDWLDMFCRYTVTKFGVQVYGVKNAPILHELLETVMLRRTLDDVALDLPKVFWQQQKLDVSLSAEFKEAEREAEASGALELRQTGATARYRRLVGEAKAPAIVSQLAEELEGSGEKVVVFAYHRTVLGALALGLHKYGVAYIDGDTSPLERDAAIGAFQHEPDVRVFVGQIQACQAGITLTAAQRVVIVEPDWTANVNVQAAQRVARIGQKAEHCVAQLISLAGTLDDAIVRVNLRETRMGQEIFADAETGNDIRPRPTLQTMREGQVAE